MNRDQIADKVKNIGSNIVQEDNESTATAAALFLFAGILHDATTVELILFGKYLKHFGENHCIGVCRCTHDAASHSDHDGRCYGPDCPCDSYVNVKEKKRK